MKFERKHWLSCFIITGLIVLAFPGLELGTIVFLFYFITIAVEGLLKTLSKRD